MTRLWTQNWTSTEQLWTSIALIGVWIASVPTAWEVFKKGNDADPLGREIRAEQANAEAKTRVNAGAVKEGRDRADQDRPESSTSEPLG